VPDVPELPAGGEEQRELLVRLRAVIEAKDTEIGVLRSGLDAERELRRRLELRVAELERRLDQDSADSGTPCDLGPGNTGLRAEHVSGQGFYGLADFQQPDADGVEYQAIG